jgi:dihydroorotate dehydrogenase
VPDVPAKDFFGFRVNSRLGVSAGILLNAGWIECYSRLGFDLLTYKTVRSARRPCYPLPNWLFVEPRPASRRDERDDPLMVALERAPASAREATSAVSFGMPSMDPAVWRRDVRKARACLRPGQVLIVSVVGTPRGGGGREALIEDFVRCARWAAQAGAHIVEANYSCPNVSSAEGSIYQDAAFSAELTRALRDALPATPLLIKAGRLAPRGRLLPFLRAVAGRADGIVIVNGIARRVVTAGGSPAFRDHERVGILGRALHAPAVASVRAALAAVEAERLALGVLAVGGVLEVGDAADFFAAGAAAVLLGGGAALAPDLAARMKTAHPEW